MLALDLVICYIHITYIRYIMRHPEWALKHKRKGTELRLINGNYYFYEVKCVWDPGKKKPKKKTGKIIGKITPEGFIESPKRKLEKTTPYIISLQVKEYGASKFILDSMTDSIRSLQNYFIDKWQFIVALAFYRLFHRPHIKNMPFHHQHSFLSEIFANLKITEKRISKFLRELGIMRSEIVKYFKDFISEGDHILIDATPLFTQSENIIISKYGYNNKRVYLPQVNLLFIFSVRNHMPVYYRITPGNVREISAFKLCIEESGARDAVIIADKGFYSEDNVNQMEENELQYIIPLKRNSILIDYSCLKSGDKRCMDGYFKYKKRFIWYSKSTLSSRTVYTYLDEHLKSVEEKDYLTRIETHPEEYHIDKFYEKQHYFGTLSVISNCTTKSAEEIFQFYKSRSSVEQMFDVFKNLLEADRTYMQNEESLEGWNFINTIALQWYYKIYQILLRKKLLSRYSVHDVLLHLSEIRKVKINNKWKIAEIDKKTEKLLDKLNINIPIT